jgi:ribose-phosphate pyrophosphokinase
MELLIMLDAVKRASAHRVSVVLPYFGYARQDRKVSPRTPITAKLVADLLQVAGADRILTLDLHAGQIQGFFNIPVDHLYGTPTLIGRIRELVGGRKCIVVSPDAGGVERARAFAKYLKAPLAVIDKRRVRANEISEMHIIGDVKDHYAVLVDDLVDTAGTLTKAAKAIMDHGATGVCAVASHAVLSPPAVARITASVLDRLVVTDSIPLRAEATACPKIESVTASHLLGEAVRRIHHNDSVSMLFEPPSL